jgi:hypothetical protein
MEIAEHAARETVAPKFTVEECYLGDEFSRVTNMQVDQYDSRTGSAISNGDVYSGTTFFIKGSADERNLSIAKLWQDCFLEVEVRSTPPNQLGAQTYQSSRVRIPRNVEQMHVEYPPIYIPVDRNTTYTWRARCVESYIYCYKSDQGGAGDPYQSRGGTAFGPFSEPRFFTTPDPMWQEVELSQITFSYGSHIKGSLDDLKADDWRYYVGSTQQRVDPGSDRKYHSLEMEAHFVKAPDRLQHLRLRYKGYYSKWSLSWIALDVFLWQDQMWHEIYRQDHGNSFDWPWSTSSAYEAPLYSDKNGNVKFRIRVGAYDEIESQELLTDVFALEAYA